MAKVTRSPRLAATGVATLSGLIRNFLETAFENFFKIESISFVYLKFNWGYYCFWSFRTSTRPSLTKNLYLGTSCVGHSATKSWYGLSVVPCPILPRYLLQIMLVCLKVIIKF